MDYHGNKRKYEKYKSKIMKFLKMNKEKVNNKYVMIQVIQKITKE